MKKNRTIIVIFSIAIILTVLFYISKPMKILNNTRKIEEINVYDIESEESADITDKDKIEEYIHGLKSLKLKKRKIVPNSSAKGIIIISKDEDGESIDTIYLSEKEINYHNWLVEIAGGANPYKKLVLELNK